MGADEGEAQQARPGYLVSDDSPRPLIEALVPQTFVRDQRVAHRNGDAVCRAEVSKAFAIASDDPRT